MVVDVDGLSFQWTRDAAFQLEVETLQLAAGERVFLHGPSGTGKSTLLNLIAGVLTGYSGQLKVFGTELSSLTGRQRDALRGDRIGFVFQQFNLLPYLSVLDNVLLPCRVSTRRRDAVLETASLRVHAESWLGQLGLGADLYDKPAVELSVGQQQRVAAARALVGRPDLIIADEPTSALDRDNCDAFLKVLIESCALNGTTLLFVSHDRALEARFDRSVSLRGEVLCSG